MQANLNYKVLDKIAEAVLTNQITDSANIKFAGLSITQTISSAFNYIAKKSGLEVNPNLFRKVLHVIFTNPNESNDLGILTNPNESYTNPTRILTNPKESNELGILTNPENRDSSTNANLNNSDNPKLNYAISILKENPEILDTIVAKGSEGIVEMFRHFSYVVETLQKVVAIVEDEDLTTDETYEDLKELLGLNQETEDEE